MAASNWGIVGHEWAVDGLRASLASDRLGHAYLISGPSAIGKRLLATRLAQAANCETGGPDPCMVCRTCRRIERGNYADVRLANMATQGAGLKPDDAARQRDLKIDTVREWLSDVTLKPYEGQRRFFILDDAERLTEAAANAMLKTLEEPPPYATLILLAHTAGDLLPTIVSRCRNLKLRPIPRQQIAAALSERLGIAPADAALLAAWSNGRYGWAATMAANPDEIEQQQGQLDAIIALGDQSRAEQLKWAEDRAKEHRGGEQAAMFATLDLWQSWWRDVMLLRAGTDDGIVFIDRRGELERAARQRSVGEIHATIVRIGAAARQIRENVSPQLAIENVLLHM